MVDKQQQCVIVGPELEQRRAKRDLAREIEAVRRRRGEIVILSRDSMQRRRALRQCGRMCCCGPLSRLHEQGAQTLVPREEIVERLFERGEIQRALQA